MNDSVEGQPSSNTVAGEKNTFWLLENKNWEYNNYEYLLTENVPRPDTIESVKLSCIKLNVDCFEFFEKILQ